MILEFCENSRPKTSANKKHFQFSFKILKCFLFELTQEVFDRPNLQYLYKSKNTIKNMEDNYHSEEDLIREINNPKKQNNKKIFILFLIVGLIAIGLYWGSNYRMVETKTKVLLKTTEGDITIELYDDMPITTGNFKNLVEQDTYNGVIFHRIIQGFMIQGGDPTGTGFGDPLIPDIKDEFTHSGGNKNNRGTISMANAGPNTGSSQFFINLVDNNFLDAKHPVFGEVVEGMDVVDKIAKTPTDAQDRPIIKVEIIEAKVL